MIPDKQGTTVTLRDMYPINHPEANTFEVSDEGVLILLTNSTDEGLVALYAAGTWLSAVSHGTHPAVDE